MSLFTNLDLMLLLISFILHTKWICLYVKKVTSLRVNNIRETISLVSLTKCFFFLWKDNKNAGSQSESILL